MIKYLLTFLVSFSVIAGSANVRIDEATGVVKSTAVGIVDFPTGVLKINGVTLTTSGSGDVVGPASATDSTVVLFDGTSGALIKDSGILLSGTNTGDEVVSSTTVSGTIELATQAEVDAGTSTTLAVTPDTLANTTLPTGPTSNLVTGVLTGGEVTINGGDSSKFDVAAGTGVVDDWTTPGSPTRTFVSWGSFTAVTVTDIATTTFTALGINSSGAIIQASGLLHTPAQTRSLIVLQGIGHVDNATITSVTDDSTPAYESVAGILDYIRVLGPLNSDNDYGENGANLLVDKLSGTTVLPFINRLNDPQSASTKINGAESPVANLFRHHLDGSGGFTISTGNTVIDPNNYDDGSGPLASMPNNQWQVQRFYFFGQTNATLVTYGQDTYGSESLATAAIFSENPTITPIAQAGRFIYALVVKEGATDLSGVDATFVKVTVGASGGGGGGGGTSLPVSDANSIVEGSGDPTKELRFEVDGLTTATIRVLTMADQNIDLTPGTGSFIGAATTNTLTNKTIDGDDNTVQDIAETSFKTASGISGTVLTSTGVGSAPTFQSPAGGGAPEGTAVLSTGEVGGTKFLREDGDGTSSWQTVAGGGGGLTVITSATNYYVDASLGTDTSGNGTASGASAWATIQYATDQIHTTQTIGAGGSITLNLAAGTYNGLSDKWKAPSGTSASAGFSILGDTGTPSNVVIATSTQMATWGNMGIRGVRFELNSGAGIVPTGNLTLDRCEIDADTAGGGNVLEVGDGAFVQLLQVTVDGGTRGSSNCFDVRRGGILFADSIAWINSPTFSKSILVQQGGKFIGQGTSTGTHSGNNAYYHGATVLNGAGGSPNTWTVNTTTLGNNFGVASIFESGSTPTTSPEIGHRFYDTDINQPVWYDGAAWNEARGTGWVKISTQTVSSGVASVDFTSGIDSTYDTYRITITEGHLAADGIIASRIGAGSFDTGSNYSGLSRYQNGSATIDTDYSDPDTYLRASGNSSIDSASTAGFGGHITYYSMRSTVLYKTVDGRIVGEGSSGGPLNAVYSGSWDNASAVDRIRIFNTGGNIDGGTFTLYGLTK